MISLPNSDAHRIRRLFRAEHLSLVIEAIIAGHSPARIWVDDSAPATALIWDGAHCVYLAGPAGQWPEVFRHEIAPSAPDLIKLYLDEEAAGESALRRPGFTVKRTAATEAFLTHCATASITPHWDSWASNTPSVAVAEKTGFRKIETYSILVVTPDIE